MSGHVCASSKQPRDYRRLATAFDEAEGALNEGPVCVHKLIAATATASSAMSIGTGDRVDNEHECLQKALFSLNKMINEDDKGSYEILALENQ